MQQDINRNLYYVERIPPLMVKKLRVRPYDPYQRLIVPKDITHHLAEDHLSRFIADVTTQLDLSRMESRYEYDRGEEGYHPRMMLNLILYGYCTGTYSSRQIQSHTYTDLAYRFLAAGMHPDFPPGEEPIEGEGDPLQ